MGRADPRSVPAADVPFFFKQWGGVRKGKAGRELDGRTHDEYPVRVVSPVPERADCHAFADEIRDLLQNALREPLVRLIA